MAQQVFPPANALPAIPELPDPFLMMSGKRVSTLAEWRLRRDELKEPFLYYEYGHFPPAPGNIVATDTTSVSALGGTAIDKRMRLTMGPDHKVIFTLRLLIPTGKPGPFPILVKNDYDVALMPIPQEAINRGYIIAEFKREEIALDSDNRNVGVYPLYPDYDWGTIAAWAWGHMRVVDYLLTLNNVDKTRIGVTGHSRGGKAALLAGAMDERIALTAPNGSGAGGCGTFRFQGPGAEALGDIMKNFPFWFHPNLKTFKGIETSLPFDQHELKALVAPRALICTDALSDPWANPQGDQRSHLAAKEVYKFLGVPEKIGIHFRPGTHDQTEDDWRTLLDFADWQFFGKQSARSFDTTAFVGIPSGFSWTSPQVLSTLPGKAVRAKDAASIAKDRVGTIDNPVRDPLGRRVDSPEKESGSTVGFRFWRKWTR